MTLPLIPADRAQHFIYGALGYVAAAAVAALLGWPQYAAHAGLAAALLLGAGKELADARANALARAAGQPPPHGVQFADLVATVAGGLVCQAAVLAAG